VYVCIYAHAHTPHVGYWDVSPGVGKRHLEGPTNPDGLNLGIYVFVYYDVYTSQMCVYVLGGVMTSWTKCLFLQHIFPLKKESKRCERNTTEIYIGLNYIDLQLESRILNYCLK